MADRRFTLVILIAIIVAIGSGFGVYSVLRTAKANVAPTARIVVAAADLPDGHLIAITDLRPALMAVGAVPAGAFTTPDSVVGRVTRMPVIAGEALVPSRLAPVGAGAGLEVRITRGKRAMAVRIDDVAGLAGVIQPNSHVDVLLIVQGPGGVADRARVFMSNMRVLSVGTTLEREPAAKADAMATMATLEVTPNEAERLAMAVNAGKIQLVLRGYGDPDSSESRGASLSDLPIHRELPAEAAPPVRVPDVRPQLSRPVEPAKREPVAPVVARAESTTVQVYRGATVTANSVARKDTTRP